MIAFIIGFSVKRVLLVKMYLVVYYTVQVSKLFGMVFSIIYVLAVFISEKVDTSLQTL